jgi:ribonuclease J
MEKLAEYDHLPKQVNILPPGEKLRLGQFTVESVRVSHSIPDATNLIISTPAGTVYHGSDFKFDFTPVDGVMPDIGRIAAAGNSGVKLLLSDSLGSERRGFTPSEKTLSDTFETLLSRCQGKFIVTSMSSNISRWYQAASVAIKHGRQIAVSGKSIKRNLDVAIRLGYFQLPSTAFIDIKEAKKRPPKNICLLMAGSQAQTGSAMERLALGEHKDISVSPGDMIVFSSDYIPGNESAVQGLIDQLSRLGAEVIYSDITDNLHVSGHGSQQDLLLMMALTKPQYLVPIGGTYRHMVQYSRLAQSMGYPADKILLPESNRSIEVFSDRVAIGPKIEIKRVMVDGLGVGDVGNVVLRDRQLLAEEGVVIAVAEVDQTDRSQIINLEIISRGFVFDRQNTELLNSASALVKKNIAEKSGKIDSDRFLRQLIIDTLEKYFFDQTHRRPMILPVVVEV